MEGASRASAEAPPNPRRRRGAGIVTPNACTECRKKRSKCDGQVPCGRCVSQNTECVYEVPVRQSKETMRGEIDQLQTHRKNSERILSALASNTLSQETYHRIRNGESIEDIADWLRTTAEQSKLSEQEVSSHVTSYASSGVREAIGGALKVAEGVANKAYSVSGGLFAPEGVHGSTRDIPWPTSRGNSGQNSSHRPSVTQGESMDWTSGGHSHSSTASTPLVGKFFQASIQDTSTNDLLSARHRGRNHILAPAYAHVEGADEPAVESWTSVISNTETVEHLISLYFCWEYPTFASLSKEHFLEDFRAGRSRFCSSLVVNAMLALGCRFSSLPESRADPERPETAGDHFFAEAKKILFEIEHRSLTTIQALGLMSIREASCGRVNESSYYAGQAIRLAVEFGLHEEPDPDLKISDNALYEVRAATFWGAFALNEAWSLTIGTVPHVSRAAKLVSKPAIIDTVESGEWVPYTDQGAPEVRNATQPSNVRSVYKCFCELSELVHQALYTLYTPGRNVTTSELLTVYTRYLNWYSALPEVLRLGHNFTPAVLFAHLYYHFAILLLFRPFIKLRFINSAVVPADVASQAADAIATLIRSYDQIYTLQRTPSFVPFIALTSSVMHLVTGYENNDSTQIMQGANDLKDLCNTHHFSQTGLDVIRLLAHRWKMGNVFDDTDPPSENQLKDMVKPLADSLNSFCPYFEGDAPDGDPRSGSALWTPFPMQGRPHIALTDEELERDGFVRAE